jgi:Transposase
VASVSHLAPIHLGLDVHKDTISVGILEPDQQIPDVERITHDEVSVRRLVGRFDDPRTLRACYEAGPTGFELARLLHSMDVRCEVIAPSLIPKAPGDKIKTDRRDCRRLARLHRAGELVCIRIPTVAEICAAPEPTWSKTSPAPATGWASSCCATGGHGGAGRPGPTPTRRGCAPSGSTSRP